MTRYRSKTPLIVVLIMVLGGVVIWSVDPSISAGRAMLLDPLAVLSGRSPGERAGGALLSTKPIRTAALQRAFRPPFVPRERVLTLVRIRPPGLDLPARFVPPVVRLIPPGATSLDGPFPLGAGPLNGGSGVPPRDVEPGLSSGPGAGGGGGLTSDYTATPSLPVR